MRRTYLGAALALALATALGVVALAPTAGAGTTRTYIVLYKQHAVANDAATRIAGNTRLPGIGGSDAHSVREVGICATEFSDQINDEPSFLDALRSGAYHARRV